MTLVAGIDSSTQSCKVVIRDADSGALQRTGAASHPKGTEVDPDHWWVALRSAIESAGGLDDVAAAAVAGQQHGMVCLDKAGEVVRPALLWNDTRSADAARALILELGEGDHARGAAQWVRSVGSVPVASLTVTKLRWLADHEPDRAGRVAAVALPHDWLTWKLSGSTDLHDLVTDRSDASGTGYYDAASDRYDRDLLATALRIPRAAGDEIVLPRVLEPNATVGHGASSLGLGHLLLGPGCGDNAGAALRLGLGSGEASISLGTSGVVAVVAEEPVRDSSGQVAGFADATGRYLGLAVTLNAARVLEAMAAILDVDHDGLAELALRAAPGAGGLTLVPYLDGERTPNLPTATGSLVGFSSASLTRENLARAAVEGLLCHMADALDAVRSLGVPIQRVTLVGGAGRSAAVQRMAPSILGLDVAVLPDSEYVADGAARQAAWVHDGGEQPPEWALGASDTLRDDPRPEVLARYREVRERLHPTSPDPVSAQATPG